MRSNLPNPFVILTGRPNLPRVGAVAAVLVVAAVGLLASQAATPQASTESTGTPEARAFFDQAQAALRTSPDYAAAAALFRKAIDADPRFVEAHSQFMFTTRQAAIGAARQAGQPPSDAGDRATRELKTLYAGWAAAHPDNAIYEWALGSLEDKDWAAAGRHYERAIALDPSFARVYLQLSLIADFRGENQKQVDLLKKAADLNPADPQYFFYYASAYKTVDPVRSIALLQEVADRYPKTERGAQGLYWAAFETHDPAAKLAIYERLRRDFPPDAFSWSESGMSGLFEVYMRSSPGKAVALAGDLSSRLTSPGDKKTWQDMAAFARAVIQARDLLSGGSAADAIAVVDKAPRPRYVETTALDLVKADARAAAGDAAGAYVDLLAAQAKAPTEAVRGALDRLGATLGKTAAAIDADLWTKLEEAAKPAPAFTLTSYETGKPVSLSDYRGRVVLVNFWYPSCGPCRGEFPTLQRVLDRYRDRGFVVLALNVYPDEDEMVLPYMRNNHFSFVPLKTDTAWAEKAYGARGFPTNALIDAAGRIVFRPGVVRGENEERTFALEVELLLKHAGR